MKFSLAEEYIHSLTRFGSQLGLERIKRLLELLDNPQKKLKFIHIAGTNGKGSTANMCSNVLKRAGYKVGMYTSPFVDDFRERFQINGKMITRSLFSRIANAVKFAADKMIKDGMQATEFEVITAIAFVYFSVEECDIVCLEVGLGGRFDATNVIETPLLAIITSISEDHVDILGDTVEKIAFEKAGIIKGGTTVVTYPLQEETALAVIKNKCIETGSTLTIPNKDLLKNVDSSEKTVHFEYDDNKYALSLIGEHQVYNAITVITAIEELRAKGFSIGKTEVLMGIYETNVPARFEKVGIIKPDTYIDGAHNIQAIKAFAKSMDNIKNDKKVVVMGMMADKDYEQSVKEIASRCNAFIALSIDNERAVDKKIIGDIAKKYCKKVMSFDDYNEAILVASELATHEGVIFACGSFYMASDLKKAIGISRHPKNIKARTDEIN